MASNKLVRVVILANEDPEGHLLWIKACEDNRDTVSWRVVDLCSSGWWEEIYADDFDILLSRPGGLHSRYKNLYDERLRILASVKGEIVFPSLTEVEIYENKRYLSYWLKAHEIPHPQTQVFYDKLEAISWLDMCKYPMVGKTNLGASGSGVMILHNREEAHKYTNRSFSVKGAPQRSGPNLAKGDVFARAFKALHSISYLKRKAKLYKMRRSDKQIGYVIFQEYIDHDFEWRAVRMGDSFFAHKKLKMGEKTSGTLLKGYGKPPLELLDFVKWITDQFGLYSQAIDVFESKDGYLVNEMQCFFGQSDPHQMIIDDVPGRYRSLDGSWVFEPGSFTAHESYNLRLLAALDSYQRNVTT